MSAMFDSLNTLVGGGIPFVVDIAFKTLVVFLLAFAITSAMRGASASARHHVWTLAFAAALTLPLLAATIPSWRVAVPGWDAASTASEVPAAIPAMPSASADRVGSASSAPIASGTETFASSRNFGPGGFGLLESALAVWLIGIVLFLLRLGVGVTSAWWTSRSAEAVDSEDWDRLVNELAAELEIRQPVRVVCSDTITTPMAWGLFRPALLLPANAVSWSADRRRAVVLHELAHVKRRDCLIHVLAQAARALNWFNPLAWVGTKRLRAERERACDDLVINAGTQRADYAKLLLDVARFRSARALSWATVSMARPSELEGRLLAILDPALNRQGIGRPAAVATLGLVLGVLIPLAALQFGPRAASAPEAVSVAVATSVETEVAVAAKVRTRVKTKVQEAEPIQLAALEAMVKALQNDNASIRSQAAHSLGMLESPLAVDALSRAVRDDESADVRSNAAWALGMIEDAAAVPALTDAMGDADADVREQSAWALGMIESPDGVPALVRALGDESASMRSQAAWALGMIESSEAVDGLVRILGSEDSADVRSQAAWALGMIESSEAVDGLVRILGADDSAEVRSQAAWALGMIEDQSAMDALIDAIEDEDEEVAEQAMWALGQVMG